MALLSSFFREKFCASLSHTNLSKQFFAYLQKGPLDKRFLQTSLLQTPLGHSPKEQMKALHSLFRIALMLEPKMTAVKNWVYPASKEILLHAVSEEVTSIFLLKKLCQKLLHQETEDTSDFSLWTAAEKQREDLLFFHPYYTLQSLLFLCLLVEFHPKVYKEKALQAFTDLHFLLDHEKVPFFSLGLKEKEFSKERVYLNYYLLFLAAGRILQKNQYVELAEKVEKLLQEKLSLIPEEQLVTATLIENWILQRTALPASFEEKRGVSSKIFFPEIGAYGNRFSKQSYVFSLAGDKTSMGALKHGAIRFAAMGPQLYDLRSTEGFGIHKRASKVSEDFSLDVSEEKVTLKGLMALAKISKWIKLEVNARENQIDFTIEPIEEEPLYFAFYVNADSVTLGEKVLQPCSLQSYQEMGNTIRIQKDQDIAILRPNDELEVKAISLAGKNCFWDSDFLLAVTLIANKKNHFSLEFS